MTSRFCLTFVLVTTKLTCAAPISTSPTNSSGFQLDLEELQKLGITPEDVVEHIKLLVQGKYVCTGDVTGKVKDDLQRYFLRNKTVTCNDGSKAGLVTSFFISLTLFYHDYYNTYEAINTVSLGFRYV